MWVGVFLGGKVFGLEAVGVCDLTIWTEMDTICGPPNEVCVCYHVAKGRSGVLRTLGEM